MDPKILSSEEKNGFNSTQYVTPGIDMTKYRAAAGFSNPGGLAVMWWA